LGTHCAGDMLGCTSMTIHRLPESTALVSATTHRPKTAFFSSNSLPHKLSIQTLHKASSTLTLSTLFTSPFSNSCKLLLNPVPSLDVTDLRLLDATCGKVVVLIGGNNLSGGNENPA